jgi:hypothetical protein
MCFTKMLNTLKVKILVDKILSKTKFALLVRVNFIQTRVSLQDSDLDPVYPEAES